MTDRPSWPVAFRWRKDPPSSLSHEPDDPGEERDVDHRAREIGDQLARARLRDREGRVCQHAFSSSQPKEARNRLNASSANRNSKFMQATARTILAAIIFAPCTARSAIAVPSPQGPPGPNVAPVTKFIVERPGKQDRVDDQEPDRKMSDPRLYLAAAVVFEFALMRGEELLFTRRLVAGSRMRITHCRPLCDRSAALPRRRR